MLNRWHISESKYIQNLEWYFKQASSYCGELSLNLRGKDKKKLENRGEDAPWALQ